MHRLLNAGRNQPPPNMNKPLPEPLVDPDEGKTPIGELIIVPIQGKDLPNRERFGKQDPFILFKLGNVAKRSSTDIRGGQRPQWKEDQINIFMYESDAKDATSLYVTCLDEDPQKNDLIGDCVINLAKVLEQGEQDDWFELSYKGREAGVLMLQLTYYSHDPRHRTNKMNRAPSTLSPSTGAPERRPIHPTKKTKSEEKSAEEEHVDEGPVYKPPVVPEPPVAQVPMVPGAIGYPYGALPAGGVGRPVSPSGQSHYVGHHTPQVPAANPYGHQPGVPPAVVNPYGAPIAGGYPGYPTAGPYPDPSLGADPSKRLSFTGQPVIPPHQPGGFLPGYPPAAVGVVPGYPAQVPVVPSYPQQSNPAYPPQIGGVGGIYPPVSGSGIVNPNISSIYAAQPLPVTGAGGPPAGYPFVASNIYPPNSNNSNSSGGFPQGPGSNNSSNNGFPGAYPGNNNNNNGNNGSPYGVNGGNNSHSNGNVNNMNNNHNGFNNNNNNNFGNNNNNNGNNGFNNGGNNFNNNNNNNNNGGGSNFNNGGNNFNNNSSGTFNNGSNGNNFNNNNNNNINNGGGGSFSNNGASNFNNGGNNFNNNNNNGNAFGYNNNNNNNNNGGGNNFNNNNGGNSFNNSTNNNNNNNNNNNSGHNHSYSNGSNNSGGGYPSATIKKNTITPTPVVATPVTQNRNVGGSMYGPDDF